MTYTVDIKCNKYMYNSDFENPIIYICAKLFKNGGLKSLPHRKSKNSVNKEQNSLFILRLFSNYRFV